MSPSPLNPMNTGRYHFDRVHTRVGFVARYAMVTKVRGQFGETAGTADLGGEVHRPPASAPGTTSGTTICAVPISSMSAHIRRFSIAAPIRLIWPVTAAAWMAR